MRMAWVFMVAGLLLQGCASQGVVPTMRNCVPGGEVLAEYIEVAKGAQRGSSVAARVVGIRIQQRGLLVDVLFTGEATALRDLAATTANLIGERYRWENDDVIELRSAEGTVDLGGWKYVEGADDEWFRGVANSRVRGSGLRTDLPESLGVIQSFPLGEPLHLPCGAYEVRFSREAVERLKAMGPYSKDADVVALFERLRWVEFDFEWRPIRALWSPCGDDEGFPTKRAVSESEIRELGRTRSQD